jgi:hypothetical protein
MPCLRPPLHEICVLCLCGVQQPQGACKGDCATSQPACGIFSCSPCSAVVILVVQAHMHTSCADQCSVAAPSPTTSRDDGMDLIALPADPSTSDSTAASKLLVGPAALRRSLPRDSWRAFFGPYWVVAVGALLLCCGCCLRVLRVPGSNSWCVLRCITCCAQLNCAVAGL